MSSYSSRVAALEPSATVRVGNLTDELRAESADIVDLSQGDPDFITPEHIRKRAKESLDDGETHYMASTGIEQFRETIAEKLRTENDLPAEADRIAVTPGGKQALFEVLFALLDDEVVLLEPSWVSPMRELSLCVAAASGGWSWTRQPGSASARPTSKRLSPTRRRQYCQHAGQPNGSRLRPHRPRTHPESRR
jgi:aspartate aminotransferase